MARGRRTYSLDEQLEKLNESIAEMEKSLAEMKETKRELENQIKQTKLIELDELIASNGYTIDEVKEMLIKKE